MKRKRFLGVFVVTACSLFCLTYFLVPTEGTARTLCEYQDPDLGTLFVVSRYDGFGSGWNVAFFHVDKQRKWLGFYLAHESVQWRNVQLRRASNLVFVEKGTAKIAEYDLVTGEFRNLLQGRTYSRAEGQIDKRQGPGWWGLEE